MEARRMEAARRFARGEPQTGIAQALGVSRVSVVRWVRAWREEGPAGLKGAGGPGFKPAVDGRQLVQLDRALRRGARAHGFDTDRWTLPRIAILIERLTEVRYHPASAWKVMRKLNWHFESGAPPGRERDVAPYRGRHGTWRKRTRRKVRRR